MSHLMQHCIFDTISLLTELVMCDIPRFGRPFADGIQDRPLEDLVVSNSSFVLPFFVIFFHHSSSGANEMFSHQWVAYNPVRLTTTSVVQPQSPYTPQL
jgi:hypothetical protein